MGRHSSLREAAVNKKDEFYTQLCDIEKELVHYPHCFKGKHVYCNCDNPYESMFVRYFVTNFDRLGLAKLTATCYCGNDRQLSLFDEEPTGRIPHKAVFSAGAEDFDAALERADKSILLGTGDFRSEECTAILKDADIVVTNPPFSLFKNFIEVVTKYGKDFIVIGNTNAAIPRSMLELFKAGRMSTGYTNFNKGMFFRIPDDYTEYTKEVDGVRYAQVISSCWFTSLKNTSKQRCLNLKACYGPEKHKKYHNYDAINVDKVVDIPYNYDGFMGVPVTFLNHYNPKQFELYGVLCATQFSEILPTRTYENAYQVNVDGTRTPSYNLNINPLLLVDRKPKGIYYTADGVDGYLVSLYARILIRLKTADAQEVI